MMPSDGLPATGGPEQGGRRTQISTRLLRDLLATTWAIQFILVFWPTSLLAEMAMALLGTYVVLAHFRLRRHALVISLTLSVVVVWLLWSGDRWPQFWEGMRTCVVFAAFLCSLMLLRIVAEKSPEIIETRHRLGQVELGGRRAAQLAGAHLVGGVISIGATAIVAAATGRDADEATRKEAARYTLRGQNLAILWSPFFVAMGVATEQVPDAHIGQIIGMGIAFAALALGLSLAAIRPSLNGIKQALWALTPAALPVTVAAGSVISLNLLSPLGSIESIIVAGPILCLVQAVRHRMDLGGVAIQTGDGLPRLRDEVAIVMAALLLGRLLVRDPTLLDWLQPLLREEVPVIAILGGGLAIMVGFGCLGVHPIISMTLITAIIFASGRVYPPVIAQLGLLGWSLGTMSSYASVSLVVASGMFRLGLRYLSVNANLRFVILFSLLSIVLLSLIDAVMVA